MTEHMPASAEWYTPESLVALIRKVHPIDFDPCTSVAANKVVNAEYYLTANEDALEQEWFGAEGSKPFAYINPPSGRRGKEYLPYLFYQKAVNELRAERLHGFIFMCFNISQLQPLARRGFPRPGAIVCIPYTRIHFWQPGRDSSSPERSNAIVLETPCIQTQERFLDVFRDVGACYRLLTA